MSNYLNGREDDFMRNDSGNDDADERNVSWSSGNDQDSEIFSCSDSE